MIVRIVKMTIDKNKVDEFKSVFSKHMKLIRNFEGCKHLELLQEEGNPTVLMTYSYWDSQESLEKYRSSNLFKEIWKTVKTMFVAKPLAWSLTQEFKI